MSVLCDALRPAWLPGINTVSGRTNRSVLGLLASQRYQVYSPTSPSTAELHFADWGDVLDAFADDCGRLSSAAFETIEGISVSPQLPKGVSWVMVRSYYGAFYAAHAILRMLGKSLTQLDSPATTAIDTVSSLYGMLPGRGLGRGLYLCEASKSTNSIRLHKTTSDGPHEALWVNFLRTINSVNVGLLSTPGASLPAQQAAAKLTELELALGAAGQVPRGNWLSVMRNQVNYHHKFGAWFPYQGRQAYYAGLEASVGAWRKDPEAISIWPQPGRELQRFVETCALIVSLCRAMAWDMAGRCPTGRSFLDFVVVRLLRHLAA